jgi:hypothetical protein
MPSFVVIRQNIVQNNFMGARSFQNVGSPFENPLKPVDFLIWLNSEVISRKKSPREVGSGRRRHNPLALPIPMPLSGCERVRLFG